MSGYDGAYHRLRAHLDGQAVGFPATRSGVELRVLRHLFTPREAEVATCLRSGFEPFDRIFERARGLVGSAQELSDMLAAIHRKGGIEAISRDGGTWYRNVPLVVGMYELQTGRLTSGFVRDVDRYLSDPRFGLSFLGTSLPQMRTIPIRESLTPRLGVGTFDEVDALLEQASGPFAIGECICRGKAAMKGRPCTVTTRKETCLGLGEMAESFLRSGNGREITRDEARVVIAANQADGLVLQPSNAERPGFICSCCGCCCGMLSVHRQLPVPLDFWATNFLAVVDPETCTGCGVCAKRCQAGAVRVTGSPPVAAVEQSRCLGCGVCVPTCRRRAVRLVKKAVETRPPPTMEALYTIIQAGKPGFWGKLRLIARLLIGGLRTGRPFTTNPRTSRKFSKTS